MFFTPLLAGFLQTAARAQSASSGQRTASDRGCVMHSTPYPSGTVVKSGRRADSPRRMCTDGQWVATEKPATVTVDEPVQAKVVCTPVKSTAAHECTCAEGGAFSLGAIVAAPGGKLRCDEFVLGKFTAWRPANPKELRRIPAR